MNTVGKALFEELFFLYKPAHVSPGEYMLYVQVIPEVSHSIREAVQYTSASPTINWCNA